MSVKLLIDLPAEAANKIFEDVEGFKAYMAEQGIVILDVGRPFEEAFEVSCSGGCGRIVKAAKPEDIVYCPNCFRSVVE